MWGQNVICRTHRSYSSIQMPMKFLMIHFARHSFIHISIYVDTQNYWNLLIFALFIIHWSDILTSYIECLKQSQRRMQFVLYTIYIHILLLVYLIIIIQRCASADVTRLNLILFLTYSVNFHSHSFKWPDTKHTENTINKKWIRALSIVMKKKKMS